MNFVIDTEQREVQEREAQSRGEYGGDEDLGGDGERGGAGGRGCSGAGAGGKRRASILSPHEIH